MHKGKEDAQGLGRSRGFLSCGEGARGGLAASDSPGQGKGLGWTPGPVMVQGPESAAHSWKLGLAFSGREDTGSCKIDLLRAVAMILIFQSCSNL